MNGEIKNFLNKYPISVTELAKQSGVSRATIYRWIESEHRPHNILYGQLIKTIRKVEKQYKNFISNK